MSVVALQPRQSRPPPDKQDARQRRVTRQLELFSLRCFDLADRVAAGELEFIDGVDLAYSAAVWADLPNAIDTSGLVDRNRSRAPTGDDIVQHTVTLAFANARRPT